MKKNLSLAFIVFYLTALLFGVFARIESWPFSNFTMFSWRMRPEMVKMYAPFFQLADGRNLSLRQKRFCRGPEFCFGVELYYFDTVFRRGHIFSGREREEYVKKLLNAKTMQAGIEAIKKQGLLPVKFLVMEVTFENQARLWTPMYKAVEHYDIAQKNK